MNYFHNTERDQVERLDPMMKALLPVLRHFFSALNDPPSQGWRHGYEVAIGIWGQGRGLSIAHAVQKFTYDLMRCGETALHFNDPLDIYARPLLTPDERTVLLLLSYMRADNTGKAREVIEGLHQGMIDPILVRHGLALAAMMDATPARHAVPKLRVVN